LWAFTLRGFLQTKWLVLTLTDTSFAQFAARELVDEIAQLGHPVLLNEILELGQLLLSVVYASLGGCRSRCNSRSSRGLLDFFDFVVTS